MMHPKRRWHEPKDAPPDLALRISSEGNTWTLCAAFRLSSGHVLLNDATSEDGAGEWAVLARNTDGTYRQIESITFGWCDAEKAARYIREIESGAYDREDLGWSGPLPTKPAHSYSEPGRYCVACA